MPPDPLDVGALLREALAARPHHTPASLARAAGMAPSNVSRALHSSDTRPAVARRLLAALGASLVVQLDPRATPAPARPPLAPHPRR